jgi:excisionase family DNA binding protein
MRSFENIQEDESFLNFIREVIRLEMRAAQSEVLTSEEAAIFLNIEKSYLYKLTSGGILPFSKPNGKMIYFSRQDLVKWALSNRRSGSDELNSKAATYLAVQKMKKSGL